MASGPSRGARVSIPPVEGSVPLGGRVGLRPRASPFLDPALHEPPQERLVADLEDSSRLRSVPTEAL